MAAGRHWAGLRGGGDEAAADAARFGLDALPAAADDRFGLWPVNRAAVEAFLAAASQWRTAGMMFVGLDYAGAAVAWAARKIELTADLMDRLQVVEAAARDALNERRG
jgi:hypothetical protein